MTTAILFLICLAASSLGAVVGAGGGVIIKPALDLLGLMPASSVSFCSGCTVLGMSVLSLIRSRKNGVRIKMRTGTALGAGAAAGGLAGKYLLELVKSRTGSENGLGAAQSVLLTLITFLVLVYICAKDRLPSLRVRNPAAAVCIGCVLGILSSFLGIGGGTSNMAVLFFFFSMEAKEAAANSLYIIIFSQLSGILTAVCTGTVPAFSRPGLAGMMAGGLCGALAGSFISKRLQSSGVERALKGLLIFLVIMDLYNTIHFIF